MTQITIPSGIRLEYEVYGDPGHPPVLLVNGFGTQLISWPREFSQCLAAGGADHGGRYVIAYDNRDTGLSQKFDGLTAPTDEILGAIMAGNPAGARAMAPYLLSDMAEDGLGLLSALGIERAHVLGASMGAMIAQTMAIEHPQRLISLTSMMSSTGEPEYGQAAPDSLTALLEASPTERSAYIDSSSRWLLWHSRRYPEAEETRIGAAEAFDRGLCPEGTQRQLAAMIASGPRDAGLRELTVPTVVIHGADDSLIAPSGGERTAELIPGAEFVMIQDMGHDRPRALWDQICEPVWKITGRS